MNKLITASDVAKRDRIISVSAWIRTVSATQVTEGKIATAWDGTKIAGEPVEAIVDTGRVLARCPDCGKHEYVSPKEKIFFCMDCGNNNSGAARPVKFPKDWDRIEAALIMRPIFPGPGLDEVQAVFRSKPIIRELKRRWRPGTTAEELMEENKRYGIGGAG